jgi:hypothetical protein
MSGAASDAPVVIDLVVDLADLEIEEIRQWVDECHTPLALARMRALLHHVEELRRDLVAYQNQNDALLARLAGSNK